jgi:spermidine/putrescine transport system permease protein
VIGGLVYGFVVFMILPVYASLERMDVSPDRGRQGPLPRPLRTFFTVTLPATRAGLYGGMLLVFLPALGDFVSAQLLGGRSTYMIGNLIQQQFAEGQNWPLGSAMTVGMMAALTVLMVVYLRATSTRAGSS